MCLPVTRPTECESFVGSFSERLSVTSQLWSYIDAIVQLTDQLDLIALTEADKSSDTTALVCIEPQIEALAKNADLIKRLTDIERNRKVPDMRASDASYAAEFASIFSNYMRLMSEYLKKASIRGGRMAKIVTSFSIVHGLYFDAVMKPGYVLDLQEFKLAWTCHRNMLSDFTMIVKEMSLPLYIGHIECICQLLIQLPVNDGKPYIDRVGAGALQIKGDIARINSGEYNVALFANVITCVTALCDSLEHVCHRLAPSSQITGRLIQESNGVKMLIPEFEKCIAGFRLTELADGVQRYMYRDRFEFDVREFRPDGYEDMMMMQAIQIATIEAKLLVACQGLYGMPEAQVIIEVLTKLRDAIVSSSIKKCKECLVDISTIQNLSTMGEEAVMGPLSGLNNMVKCHTTDNWTIEDRGKTIQAIQLVAKGFRCREENLTPDKFSEIMGNISLCDYLFCVHRYNTSRDELQQILYVSGLTCMNFLTVKLKKMCKVFCQWIENMQEYTTNVMAPTQIFVASAVENMSAMLSNILKQFPQGEKKFLTCLAVFLDVYGLLISLNKDDDVNESLRLLLGSFPSVADVHTAIPVQMMTDDIRKTMEQLKSTINSCVKDSRAIRNHANGGSWAQMAVNCSMSCGTSSSLSANLSRMIGDLRVASRFVRTYETTMDAICVKVQSTGSANGAMSVDIVTEFEQLSRCILSLFRMKIMPRRAHSVFYASWIDFLQSGMANVRGIDRKGTCENFIETMPFCNFAVHLQRAFKRLKMIGSKVHWYAAMHKDQDVEQVIVAHGKFERAFVSILARNDKAAVRIDTASEEFLSSVMKVSVTLYDEIRSMWGPVAKLFAIISTLTTLDMHVQRLRRLYEMNRDESCVDACILSNFVMVSVKLATMISKTGYMRGSMMDSVTQCNASLIAACKALTLYSQRVGEFCKIVEVHFEPVRRALTGDVIKNLGETARAHLADLFGQLTWPVMGNAAETVEKLVCVGELLDMFDDDECELDKFTILCQIMSAMKSIRDAQFPERKAAMSDFVSIIRFGMLSLLLTSQLVVLNLFSVERRLGSVRSTIKGASGSSQQHALKLPWLVSELKKEIRRIPHGADPRTRETVSSLMSDTNELSDMLETAIRGSCSHETLEAGKSELDECQNLLSTLSAVKNDYERHRAMWIAKHRKCSVGFEEDINAFADVCAELERMDEKVDRLRMTELTWRQSFGRQLQMREPVVGDRSGATSRCFPNDSPYNKESITSRMRKQLSEALDTNVRLRREIARVGRGSVTPVNSHTANFMGQVSVSMPVDDDYDVRVGKTQMQHEEKLMVELDMVRKFSSVEPRVFIGRLDRVLHLNCLQKSMNQRLRNEIAAAKDATHRKSVLSRLLDQ